MSFDFPSSPNTGQQFTPVAGGPTYLWNGYAWDLVQPLTIPGSLVEIARQTITSAVASVEFKGGLDATYDEYELHFYGVRVAATDNVGLQISNDNGATWKTDGNYTYGIYNIGYVSAPAAPQNYTAGAIAVVPTQDSTNGSAFGIVRFSNPLATEIHTFRFDSVSYNSSVSGITRYMGGGGYIGNNNPINGIRFVKWTGGNLTAGTFVLYGRAKAPVIMPSGGGGVFSTGDLKSTHNPTPPAGWVLWNDGTIGDVLSGASNRAAVDVQDLFTLYYGGYSDANCPLLTSSGAATTRAAQGTAAAAWAAHCRMTLPKGAGRVIGNAGAGSGLTSRTAGDAVGAETKTQGTTELVSHAHTGIGYPNVDTTGGWSAWTNVGIALTRLDNTQAAGGSAPSTIMQPTSFIYWMIKL